MPAGSQPDGTGPCGHRDGARLHDHRPSLPSWATQEARLRELPLLRLGPGAPAAWPVERSRTPADGGNTPGLLAPRPAPSPERVGSTAWVRARSVPCLSGAVHREGVPRGWASPRWGTLGWAVGWGCRSGVSPRPGWPAVLRNASRGRQRSSGLRKSGGAHPQCLPPFDIPLCFVNQQELEEIRKCGMKNFRNIQVDEANLLTWQGLIVPVSTGQLPSSSPDGAGRRADGRLPGPGKAVCADRTPSADQPPPPLGRAGGSRLVLCLRSCPAVRLSPVLCAPASWFPPGTPPSPAPIRASCCLSPCPASLLVSLGSRPGSAPRPVPCHPASSVHAQPLRRGLLWPPCPLGSAAPLSAALPNSPCRDASLKDSSGDPSFLQRPLEVSGRSPRPSVLSCACPQPVQSLSPFCLSGTLLLFSSEVPAWQCRHEGAIPGSGRSPGEGNGNPFQYSCLGNSTDRGAWWAAVHGVARVRRD